MHFLVYHHPRFVDVLPALAAPFGFDAITAFVELSTCSHLRLPLAVPPAEVRDGAYELLSGDRWEESLTWDVPGWPAPIALASFTPMPDFLLEVLAEQLRAFAEVELVPICDLATASPLLTEVLRDGDRITLLWDLAFPPTARAEALLALPDARDVACQMACYRSDGTSGDEHEARIRNAWQAHAPELPVPQIFCPI